MRVEHDGVYAVVASMRLPRTRLLLQPGANPHVESQDGATKRDYAAREVNGREEHLVETSVETWPTTPRIRPGRTGRFPVFVLSRWSRIRPSGEDVHRQWGRRSPARIRPGPLHGRSLGQSGATAPRP